MPLSIAQASVQFADGSQDGDGLAGAPAGRRRGVSSVVRIDGQDRLAELARMLGGRQSATALEHAAELVVDAQRYRADHRPGGR